LFDIFLDYIKGLLKSRLFPITLIFIALFIVIINRLFVLQIVNGPETAIKNETKYNKPREIKSTRGNIYDRNGKLLASNVLSYTIVMDDNTKIENNKQRNEIISKLIKILEKNDDTLDSEFYIRQKSNGDFEFTVEGAALTRFLKNVYVYILDDKSKLSEEQVKTYLKSAYNYLISGETKLSNEQKKVLARDTYEFLRKGTGDNYTHMFDIDDSYSVDDSLKIMNLRYALFINYPKYNQITIASNVSDITVAAVEENRAELPGVEVEQQTQRVYQDALYMAHIIGYTGLINSEELEEAEHEGLDYNSTDYIGKTGVEKEYEEKLSGKKGSENVVVNNSGKVVKVTDRIDPVAGNDIYLTIDSDLQRNSYHILEREIAEILLKNIVSDMNYGSKGESAAEITIPIYEVYYALINNNIIDITSFDDSGATELEKKVYTKYISERDNIFSKYNELLSSKSTITNKQAGDMEEFLEYFHDILIKQQILIKNNIPSDDTVYKSYLNDNISLSSFLQYAINNNWIDLSKLGVGGDFFITDEIYQKLISYVENLLKSDDVFIKKIYHKLIFSYKLTGNEICLLLFDQGVLEYNSSEINSLKSSSSAYTFITDKIRSLDITPAMLALEPCSGSLVITDVKTGEVLALVTYPSYDNNLFANKIDYKYFTKLNNDKSLPMRNRPIMQRTAPGSTFKMVTSFAALEEGVVTPNEKIRDLGEFDKIWPPAKCHIYPGSHGSVNITDAIKVSCNYFFYEMGWRLSTTSSGEYNPQLGLSKLQKYATLFGLNEPSGIELDEALPQISDTDAVRSSIGQGSNDYTPAQLARYVTTLASRGKCYDLTLLDKVVDKDGKVIEDNNAAIIHDLTNISSTTWEGVLQGMYDVVNNPNGGSVYSTFKNFPVTVAGKTGTSQISKIHPNNALFVSYAPYEKPEIAIAAVIPNGYTSHNAAELAKDIYTLYFGLEDPRSLIEGDIEINDTNTGGALE
jgi:penicillin-binding protein 2